MNELEKPWVYALLVILLAAMALKISLLAVDAVPFNADEAIVALMARHIRQGEHTFFFYGQAYMGSLDAYLVAGAFSLIGESVLAVRVVQMLLFAGMLLTTYAVAQRFTGSPRTALITVLLLAFPPVLLTLYTTVSLGGYGEALLIGNLLLWLGHRLAREDRDRPWAWLAWGFLAGLGFWAFGLVLVYAIPVAVWLLRHLLDHAQQDPPLRPTFHVSRFTFYVLRLLLPAAGFALGSLSWWLGNLGQVDTGLAELLGTAVRSTATARGFLANVGTRVFNFVVLGLPALFGLRFPWSPEGPPLWLAVPALTLYLGAIAFALRRSSRSRPGYRLLWGICAALLIGFVLTPFGGDPSGRYFLPLYLPLSIFTADALNELRARIAQRAGHRAGRWVWLLLAAVLAFNLVGTARAALDNPPGITTQFDPISQVDHHAYDELIRFLRAHGATRGYTNYWVAYPVAFLSNEEIILVPRLPYKADLRYTPRDNRYEPYNRLVEASPTAVYVTTNHPRLDAILRQQFADLGVSFRERQISSYHVFYDLSRHVTPEELAIPSPDPDD
jgi:4-amino-4-deoxy-L-arabinose transferase-like glycosyltransferase